MLSKTVLAVGAIASLAAAIPMQQNKRDVVWTTQTEAEYVTVDVTTTIWLAPGETPPVEPAGVPAGNPGHYGHHGHGGKPKVTSHIKSTVTVPPAPEETYAAPSEPAAPETPSSPYVAPTPTSTYEAPAYSSPAPIESPPPAQPTKKPSNGGGSPPSGGATDGSGDMTYYTPGLGSCGETNTDSDSIVALAEDMMLANWPSPNNPNANPLCGKSITISWQGKTATATIADTCPGCANGGLDLTPSLFQEFAPLSEGRLTGMTWSFN
jgi:hypothetical protein